MVRYRRVVVKVSGEALAGDGGWGTNPLALGYLADEIASLHEIGVQTAVVVGGGNYFRGRMAEGWGIGRAEADNIGMLGTVMNALMLRGALTARCEADVRPSEVDGLPFSCSGSATAFFLTWCAITLRTMLIFFSLLAMAV